MTLRPTSRSLLPWPGIALAATGAIGLLLGGAGWWLSLAVFGVWLGSLWLVRPEPQDVRAIAGLLGIRYRALADGEFNHTSALVLLDADGRVVARTERVGGLPDPAFLAAVRRTLAR